MRKFMIAAVLCLFSVCAFAQEDTNALWGELMEGNARFVKGSIEYQSLRQLRNATAGGQAPQTSILSCSDSRVPVELIFDRTVGELFVVRVAGNVDDVFGIASLEYAASSPRYWTKLIVIMGHSDCGAVKASFTEPKPPGTPTPSLYALIMRIRKSFTARDEDLKARTIDNVCYTYRQLQGNAVFGKLPMKTAYYNASTGAVEEVSCPKMMAEATPLAHSSH